jgi:GT2 family glycosyltransferase
MQKVVLIVLNYNDAETTLNFIKNHHDIALIGKIIVVDNCSSDNSLSILKSLDYDKLDVINTSKNGGYAYGNNFGVNYAKNNYTYENLVISNPDVIFNQHLLIKMMEVLETDASIAQVSTFIQGEDTKLRNVAWKLPTFHDDFYSLFFPNSDTTFTNYLHNCKKNKSGYFVDSISGAFFMIKLKKFLELGLFDERTFLYGEENLLSFKIKNIGNSNFLLKDYSYYHYESKTIKKQIRSPYKRFKYLRHSRFIFHKHYLKKSIFLCFLYSIFFTIQFSLMLFLRKIWFLI